MELAVSAMFTQVNMVFLGHAAVSTNYGNVDIFRGL